MRHSNYDRLTARYGSEVTLLVALHLIERQMIRLYERDLSGKGTLDPKVAKENMKDFLRRNVVTRRKIKLLTKKRRLL